MKSWTLTGSGCPAGRHSGPGVLVRADQFLLLGVHADHRVTRGQVRLGLLVEVAELGVAVGVLAALDGLGVGLQAETLLAQQPGHGVRRRPGDPPRSAPRPACGSTASSSTAATRVPAPGRLHQRQQRRDATPDRSRSASCGRRRARRTRSEAAPARPPARPPPARSVDRDAPLAGPPRAIPPWPSDRASAAITSRCCRSSRCGNTARTSPAATPPHPPAPPLPHHGLPNLK